MVHVGRIATVVMVAFGSRDPFYEPHQFTTLHLSAERAGVHCPPLQRYFCSESSGEESTERARCPRF
jgi:hypothetical protein